MNFEQQKQKIQEMINDGQKRVEDITSKYTNYIKQNKQVSDELEQLVSKLKECTGNLGKIGEAYQRSKEETKKMEEEFAAKVQQSEIESTQRNQQAEEALRKQKEELEAAAATKKQELETQLQEQKRVDDEALSQLKKENEEAMNALKKQKADADTLAAQQMEQAKNEAAQALEAQSKEAQEKLMKQHEFDEQAKANVRMQFEEFRTKAAQELEELKQQATADKETSDNAHEELMKQQKTQNEELLAKKDDDHKAAIEKMKSEFEKAQEELKMTLEGTQSTALEQAKLKCQEERQNLVDQITEFQKSIQQLTANQDEEVKISLQGFKDTVTETCTKIQEIQDQIPKGEVVSPEVPVPQLKTEEKPVGPKPKFLEPNPAPRRYDPAGPKLGEEAAKYFRVPVSKNEGASINWITDWYDGIICLRSGASCMPVEVVSDPKQYYYSQLVEAINDTKDKFSKEEYEKMHKENSSQVYRYLLNKLGPYHLMDVGEHNMKMLMADWLVLYTEYLNKGPDVGEPKLKEYYSSEGHRQWFMGSTQGVQSPEWTKWTKAQWHPKLSEMRNKLKSLKTPGAMHKYTPPHHRRGSRSKSPVRKGGFRYGMKIPRRRTLRSKLKTQRLKSVKKNGKRKGKKSRKNRRRKKTAKNKK